MSIESIETVCLHLLNEHGFLFHRFDTVNFTVNIVVTFD